MMKSSIGIGRWGQKCHQRSTCLPLRTRQISCKHIQTRACPLRCISPEQGSVGRDIAAPQRLHSFSQQLPGTRYYSQAAKPPLPPLEPKPTPKLTDVAPGITLLEPLSRRGTGPGIIILASEDSLPVDDLAIKNGVPSSLMKWAEESFTVVQIRKEALEKSTSALQDAVSALQAHEKCVSDKGGIGLVAYDPDLWHKVQESLSTIPQVKAAVIYGSASSSNAIARPSIPTLEHLAGPLPEGQKPLRSSDVTTHHYSSSISHLFSTPLSSAFHYANESVSHTRNLAFFKPILGGPYFDLEALWEEHTAYEFDNRSVEHTMSTMVQEPYVNHVPTLTGGIGQTQLTAFYAHSFIFSNPPDTSLELISRTVGIDRVVDEFIFQFTHTAEVPWLIPGFPPTGKKIELAFTAIINIRGDRLYHEHITWDHASILKQLDLLPEWVEWPHELSEEYRERYKLGKEGRLEVKLPVYGIESAMKMRDKNSVESNLLMREEEEGMSVRRKTG